MMSRQRLMVVFVALLACLVGWLALHDSPWLEFDLGVVLIGMALGCVVYWRPTWSWPFLVHCGVTAYFFRCFVLLWMGPAAFKALALRDAVLGLAVLGVARLVRHAVRGGTAEGGQTAAQELDPAVDSSLALGETLGEGVNSPQPSPATRRSSGGREGEAIWSPPQFTLKALFVLTVAWAGILTVAVTVKPAAAFVVLMLGAVWWLIAGIVRLVKLGSSGENR